ncbi:transposase family protein [Rhodococcus sp. ACT016]|uniref:transposase family protein n=1 Tax=Rhodococcus sp. ACT016 TaxID=3134808 RepID=UPI003D283BE4
MPARVSDARILEVRDQVPDPRARRGVRHRLTVILTVALAAVCAGARSFTAIAEWVHDAPTEAPGRLGIEGRPPSESTIRRTLARVDAGVVDQVIGLWVWLRTSMIDGRRLVAVDGKTLRGAKDSAEHLTHRLAALDQGSGVVLGQVEVGAKTNEIPCRSICSACSTSPMLWSPRMPCAAGGPLPNASWAGAGTTCSPSGTTDVPYGIS